MIPVARLAEPADFDKKVRKPGNKWLKDHPGVKRPKPLWKDFLEPLDVGFHGLCGYAAMYDPTGGTVDHFISYKTRSDLAYEWNNYRFASEPLNKSKQNADDSVLDPYEVGAGWFEILLPSMQMRMTDSVPDAYRGKAEYTLSRLKLRDGERIIRWRRKWFQMYTEGKLPLDGLREVAPLIADAVDRQQKQPGSRPGRDTSI